MEAARKSVKPGYCDERDNGGGSQCWLSGRDCEGSWTSGMDLIGTRFDCTLHKRLLEMPLGKCSFGNPGSLTTTCAPNRESCEQITTPNKPLFTQFSTAASSSEADTDAVSCWVATTKFGSCTRNNDDDPMCRFSPNDCPDNQFAEWIFPHETCSCAKVPVGACQDKQEPSAVVCAVDPQACNPTLHTWIPVQELHSKLGFDCFLCRPPFNSNYNTPGDENVDEAISTSVRSTSRNVVVGTIAVAAIFSALLLVAIAWYCSCRRRQYDDKHNSTTDIPPDNVIVLDNSSTRMMEETSDDISVL